MDGDPIDGDMDVVAARGGVTESRENDARSAEFMMGSGAADGAGGGGGGYAAEGAS